MNAPAAPVCHIDWLVTDDGARLRRGHWRPASPRGRVLLLQGLSEFLEKYTEVAARLCARGFEVWSFDWRGQGHSAAGDGPPQDAFDRHLLDLGLALAALGPGPTPLLLAHSMGGHLALRLLLERPTLVARAVLVAPMIGIHTGRWPLRIAQRLARAMIRLGFGPRVLPGRRHYTPLTIPFALNPLTGDRDNYERLRRRIADDPALRFGQVDWHWLAAAFASIDRLHAADPSRLTTPLTLLLAGRDVVVNSHAAARFAARLPQASAQWFADARHELLMETPAIQTGVWAAIDRAFGAPQ